MVRGTGGWPAKRQHHKGRKRPRAWHHGWRDGKRWLGHLENLENHVRGYEKRLGRGD